MQDAQSGNQGPQGFVPDWTKADFYIFTPDRGTEPLAVVGGSEGRKVLVGRLYKSMNTNWHEWAENTFEGVCEAIGKRREDGKVNDAPDEIIEVVVVRRAVVKGEIQVEEVTA